MKRERNTDNAISIRTDSEDLLYNFGSKKTVSNINEMVNEPIWKDYLIDKWTVIRDRYFNGLIFQKYYMDRQRVKQIIYSGGDIYGDGLYKIYSVRIRFLSKRDFYPIPEAFALEYGPVECARKGQTFLERLHSDGLVTDEEKAILGDSAKAREFSKSLFEIKEIPI